MPNTVACLRIHLLHVGEEVSGSGALGFVFMWALFQLFFVVMSVGIGLNVSLMAEAERADDGQRHFLHAELGGHGGEVSLESEVHQSGMDDVILMVAEGNLGAAQLLCEVKELLAALPGT